jgi:6-pyruvoyltetrahydropterin/6-carboxytetrahydropterin synthase
MVLPMFRIAKLFNFSASHTIGGLPADHPCSRLHGHNYQVEVVLAYPRLNNVGMVRDYRELSALRTFIDEKLDHRHLNDVFGHDTTTAEFMSAWLFDWCRTRWPGSRKGARQRNARHLGRIQTRLTEEG